MTELSEAQCESLKAISAHCTRTYRGSTSLLTLDDRYDTALSAVVEHVAEHGWPDDDKALFRAASAALAREQRDRLKHVNHGSFWHTPPGSDDDLAERVTDRLAVRQLCWAFTQAEWEAVWATAETMRTGGRVPEAAALIGVNEANLTLRLSVARKRARALWVSPGDTPPGHFKPNLGGRPTRYAQWRYQRTKRENRKARQAA